MVALVLACVLAFPRYVVDRDLGKGAEPLTSDVRLKATNDVRTTLLQGLAGAFFLATAFFTWRQIRLSQRQIQISEDQQIAERFTRAVDQLGSASLDVRLGGIYALERIACDSKRDFDVVAEVLTAFVRGRARSPGSVAADRPSADVQAILTVLARRHQYGDTSVRRLDLTGAELPGARLRGARLERVVLNDANLARADLRDARLDGAFLVGADLTRANLTDAQLPDARLFDAKLQRAILQRTDLSGARAAGARVEGARLFGTILDGARLANVNLEEARYDRLSYSAQTQWPEGFRPRSEDVPPPVAAPS